MKPSRSYFWKESNPGDLESMSRKQQGSHEVGGRAHPLGRALHPCGPLVAPLTYIYDKFYLQAVVVTSYLFDCHVSPSLCKPDGLADRTRIH